MTYFVLIIEFICTTDRVVNKYSYVSFSRAVTCCHVSTGLFWYMNHNGAVFVISQSQDLIYGECWWLQEWCASSTALWLVLCMSKSTMHCINLMICEKTVYKKCIMHTNIGWNPRVQVCLWSMFVFQTVKKAGSLWLLWPILHFGIFILFYTILYYLYYFSLCLIKLIWSACEVVDDNILTLQLASTSTKLERNSWKC